MIGFNLKALCVLECLRAQCSAQSYFVFCILDSRENINSSKKVYPARALRALGLLLANGALTVGRGKTFYRTRVRSLAMLVTH